MTRRPLLGLLAVICLSTAAAAQHNWPRFRGPNADGVAPDNAGLPTTWNNTDNVAWVADVPGWGWSCPIVRGDHVFLTSVIGEKENLTPSKGLYLGRGVRESAKGVHHWMVYCFDLNTGTFFAYNGLLFCLSEDGLTYVVKAGPEFEIVARNELDDLTIASPAIAGDKLLIRTASKLYCLTKGAKLDPAAGIVAGKLYLAGGSPNGATPQPGVWSRAAP